MDAVNVGDFVIPKNSLVLFNLFSVHMDEKYWEKPFEFRPERFLTDDGNLLIHDSFLPFGNLRDRSINC